MQFPTVYNESPETAEVHNDNRQPIAHWDSLPVSVYKAHGQNVYFKKNLK